MDKLVEKGLTVGISLGAGLIATKTFDFVWKQVTGEDTPKHEDIDAVSLKKALIFAVTSAAVSGAVQVLSQRGAMAGARKFQTAYGKRSEV
ncbi:DUF4235 domain-containing protein [Nesterenkonia sp.]|uniref:DUF4235 domain-containing protein n=1 Tax=Nesterenkonia sp. TaxID=704201 RepID=UPI0026174C0D|nr:DUF4235 domain-containing protein [Nesterenkonia sp.]